MNILRRTHAAYSDAELQKEAMDRAIADLDKKERRADAAREESRRVQ
jgi:hypothetical protein